MIALALAAALAAMPPDPNAIPASGFGTSCASITGPNRNRTTLTGALGFMLGYLFRAGEGAARDPIKEIEPAALVQWVQAYCTANPDASISGVAVALERDVMSRPAP